MLLATSTHRRAAKLQRGWGYFDHVIIADLAEAGKSEARPYEERFISEQPDREKKKAKSRMASTGFSFW